MEKKDNLVLILGAGGREDALSKSLSKSEFIKEIFVAPGNPGIGEFNSFEKRATITSLPHLKTIQDFFNFALDKKIDLTIVGSEDYLANGIVDLFNEHNLKIVGPSKQASMIESSKMFAKDLMKKYKIPTAKYNIVNSAIEALQHITKENFLSPIVLKASPLAKGKGVFVCKNVMEAHDALRFLNKNNLYPIVIEEMLYGKELSHFTLCDGEDYIFVGHACDYKRLLNQDEGPNTGGMGSYAPCDWISKEEEDIIENTIIKPTLKAMNESGVPFRGILFTGIMMTKEGPKVLEYNARFGDPETQSILPILDEDLFPYLMGVANNNLKNIKNNKTKLKIKNEHAVHVVLSSKNYPYGTSPSIPLELTQLIKLKDGRYQENSELIFAGVKKDEKGKLLSSGGRIMGVTTTSDDRLKARMHAYHLIKEMPLSDFHLREDIGL